MKRGEVGVESFKTESRERKFVPQHKIPHTAFETAVCLACTVIMSFFCQVI